MYSTESHLLLSSNHALDTSVQYNCKFACIAVWQVRATQTCVWRRANLTVLVITNCPSVRMLPLIALFRNVQGSCLCGMQVELHRYCARTGIHMLVTIETIPDALNMLRWLACAVGVNFVKKHVLGPLYAVFTDTLAQPETRGKALKCLIAGKLQSQSALSLCLDMQLQPGTWSGTVLPARSGEA